MSRSRKIPEKVRCLLWGKAAGRCEMCNKPVSYHSRTKEMVNLADAAHIVGFSEDGPRGEKSLSVDLAKDLSNLMLLCKECHETIDANKTVYPIELLRNQKLAHERRIEMATGIAPDRQSHVLLYGANVGIHSAPLTGLKAQCAMFPDWFPADVTPIFLGMINSSFEDRDAEFWRVEASQLRTMFARQVKHRLAIGDIQHLSLFAFAPQPLLMLFGYLLSDIPAAETYQLHREPPDWVWQKSNDDFDYEIQEPKVLTGPPALVIALSGTITDDRVNRVLTAGASIWRFTIAELSNDFLKSRKQLQTFRERMRSLLDRIKAQHGESEILHVFPAAPVAINVDFGRIIQPKADMSMRIYDQNRKNGGFVHALDLDERRHMEVVVA